MAAHDHHVAYFWIVALVFIVTMAGAYFLKGPGTLTGNVIAEPASSFDCDACAGSPVCAVTGATASNYENACAAACAGARIIHGDICERI